MCPGWIAALERACQLSNAGTVVSGAQRLLSALESKEVLA
jgi:hypothetical protein